MKNLKVAIGGLMMGVMFVCICMLIILVRKGACGDGHQEELMRRIVSIQQSAQDIQGHDEKLVNEICEVPNRNVKVTLLQLFAKNVKSRSCNSLDLQLRCRELSRCRQLTEEACDGFRRIGGQSFDIWDLRLSMLARYVNATNECHRSWEKFERYENEREQEKDASGMSPFISSGQGQAGWLKSIEGDIDHYLMEISKWFYRVDSCSLSVEERTKIKLAIEQISGRKLNFVEPQ